MKNQKMRFPSDRVLSPQKLEHLLVVGLMVGQVPRLLCGVAGLASSADAIESIDIETGGGGASATSTSTSMASVLDSEAPIFGHFC